MTRQEAVQKVREYLLQFYDEGDFRIMESYDRGTYWDIGVLIGGASSIYNVDKVTGQVTPTSP